MKHVHSFLEIRFLPIYSKFHTFEVFGMCSLPFSSSSLFKLWSMIFFNTEGIDKRWPRRFEERHVFHIRINLDFELIFQCFGNIHMVMFIWVLMFMATAIVAFMGYHQWAKNRVFYLKNARNLSNQSFW